MVTPSDHHIFLNLGKVGAQRATRYTKALLLPPGLVPSERATLRAPSDIATCDGLGKQRPRNLLRFLIWPAQLEEILLIKMSDGLWKETVTIAKDYLSLCCSSQRLTPRTPNRLAVGMRHLTERFEQRNQNVVYAMAQMLRPWLGQDPITNLRMVLAEMPRDGSLTWHQVVGIFTMVGVLAKQLQAQRSHQDQQEEEAEEEQSHDNRRLAVAIADFLADVQKDWLLEHDGWDGFCKFYLHSFYANNKLLVKATLYTTIGMGLTCLTFLAGRKMFTYVLHVFLSWGNR